MIKYFYLDPLLKPNPIVMKQKLHSTAIGRICRCRRISAKLEHAIGLLGG